MKSLFAKSDTVTLFLKDFQKNMFFICYHVFLMCLLAVFLLLLFNHNNPTAVGLISLGIHNNSFLKADLTVFTNELFKCLLKLNNIC